MGTVELAARRIVAITRVRFGKPPARRLRGSGVRILAGVLDDYLEDVKVPTEPVDRTQLATSRIIRREP